MRRVGSTPQQRGCDTGGCPDVIELDSGDYLVIGKGAQLSQVDWERVNARGAWVGADEGAVVVPRDCITAAMLEIFEEGAIKRVRDLHRPVWYRGVKICVECSDYAGGSTDNPPKLHPCLTVQLLDEEGGAP